MVLKLNEGTVISFSLFKIKVGPQARLSVDSKRRRQEKWKRWSTRRECKDATKKSFQWIMNSAFISSSPGVDIPVLPSSHQRFLRPCQLSQVTSGQRTVRMLRCRANFDTSHFLHVTASSAETQLCTSLINRLLLLHLDVSTSASAKNGPYIFASANNDWRKSL